MDLNFFVCWLFIFEGLTLLVNTFILIILAFFYSRLKSYEFTRKIQNSAND